MYSLIGENKLNPQILKHPHPIFGHFQYQCLKLPLCRRNRIKFVFGPSKRYICELHYLILLPWRFEVSRTTFARSYWHMQIDFMRGGNPLLPSHGIFGEDNNFWTLAFWPYHIMCLSKEFEPINLGRSLEIQTRSVTLKVHGSNKDIFFLLLEFAFDHYKSILTF